MSMSTNEEQLRSIDKAVEEHLAAIQVLRYQRNCLVPISLLPPEILSRIFSLVKSSLAYSYDALAWIKVTHVSTHWRSVGISSPTLWDTPPPGNGPWVEEMLKRSKTVDLSVTTDFSSRALVSRNVAGLTIILRHSGSRIKHLELKNMTSLCEEVLELLPASAPRLETLLLRGQAGRGSRHVCIPETALNNAENLCRLELSGVNIHWHHLYLSNITYLTLRNISDTARPTWTQFMDALAKMSKLESLDLKSMLDPAIKLEADISSGTIHLSCLQTLDVESPAAEIEMFFRHVAFPPTVLVRVKIIPQTREISEISTVISSIAQLYSCQEFRTLALRDCESNGPNSVRFQLFPKVFESPNAMYLDAKPSANLKALTLEIMTSSSGGQLTVDEIVPEFFKNGFPLGKVSHAEIATKANCRTLTDTLGKLPTLSYIRVEQKSGESFVNALYPHSEAVDAEYFPLYFKNLVSISLSIMFESQDIGVTQSEHDVDLEMLQDCLIQRYECGAEIQKLILDDCYRLDDDGAQELDNIVVDIQWDGIVQGFEGESEDESVDYDLLAVWQQPGELTLKLTSI